MKTILFHFTEEDTSYLPMLKGILHGRAQTYLDNKVPIAATELVLKSKAHDGCPVFSTSQKLLNFVLPDAANPRLDDYAGSTVVFGGCKFIFLDPLKHLVTVTYGKFVLQRYLDKVLAPEKWIVEPVFKWELFHPKNYRELSEFFAACDLIGVDTETLVGDPERRFTCVGYCGMQLRGGQIILRTVVVPLDEMYNLSFVREINRNVAPKVFQNGKYDNAYFFRFGAPVTAYTFDTINMFHSWFSELPKDLGFINAFMLKEYQFHKNDGKSGDKLDYYQYNAMDCYTTVLSCLALMLEMPSYAERNFLAEFPLVFPSHLSEMTGFKWDEKKAAELLSRVEETMAKEKAKLQRMVACTTYNPNSSQQTVRLFAILGSKDITNSDAIAQDKVANRHPLNKRIVGGITKYREDMKLQSSYFKESIPWKGRCFYALNPHGTDTGRNASRESQYWCGLQIQNIPVDGDTEADITVKEAFVADSDFYVGEADYSQAETFDSAYLSGDTALISRIDDRSKDFHGLNAAAFFGQPYESIVKSVFDEENQEWLHKTLAKPLRNLSKRTNHGANYNMGEQVLLDTMGIEKVIQAKALLGLPAHWPLLRVTRYLLIQFDKTYPTLRNLETGYYAKIVTDVITNGLLVGPTGWTRRCFGDPKKVKHWLNAYVAHPSQSLNAMTLNKAYVRVFYNVWMRNARNFKLNAQVHDSILFQYRIGHEYLAWQVAECMKIPTPVTDIYGITRTLTVPVDIKGGGKTWATVEKLVKPKVREVAVL